MLRIGACSWTVHGLQADYVITCAYIMFRCDTSLLHLHLRLQSPEAELAPKATMYA